MGCTSAKHVSSVPSEEEEEGGGKAKAYQNGDAFGDQYKLKAVEEVKYMRSGDEDGVTARNQENLVRGERGEEHRVTAHSQENLVRGERREEGRGTE
ncbi:hypothetical protein EOD39_15140 [Acipenser ruthenus]|uniref:Uncharacterized protein n=1 Tax=Acipenser ruthenus TaxID=7906 RepID=A0A662YK22_ACIRT|nr:hypothetical protein EOD39_15140 [Acipenser ruthenus]